MNPTSIATYQRIKSSGLIRGVRFKVFECIHHWGPITATQVFDRLGLKTNNSGRFTELSSMGAIKPVGIRENAGGNPETIWEVTGNMPTKLTKSSPVDTIRANVLAEIAKLSKHINEDQKAQLRQAYAIIKQIQQ